MNGTEPRCAACLNAIGGKGQLGKVIGTEAFHHTCVQNGGVQRSQLRKAQARIHELESEVTRVNALHDARREAVKDATELLGDAKLRVNDLSRQLREEVRERGHMFDAMAQAKRDRDIAIIERDAARRETALHQHLSRQAPDPAPAQVVETTPEAEPAEEIDGSKLRFELLELT